jgi:L-seryl-tRNA(Ser) seleniumtransferase
MPTRVIAINAREVSLAELEKKLRQYKVPVVARIYRDRLILDVRTIMEEEFSIVEAALKWAFSKLQGDKVKEGEGRA